MMQKFPPRFLILLAFWSFSFHFIHAQTLDHEIFLQEIKNSSDQIYLQCLNKYESYLRKNPDDLRVHIEKCKFIQFAQYDEDEGINPNQAAFDSCVSSLVEKFPNEPEVLIFQISFLWGDELNDVFVKAENSVRENPQIWSRENLASLYLAISDNYYWEYNNDQ